MMKHFYRGSQIAMIKNNIWELYSSFDGWACNLLRNSLNSILSVLFAHNFLESFWNKVFASEFCWFYVLSSALCVVRCCTEHSETYIWRPLSQALACLLIVHQPGYAMHSLHSQCCMRCVLCFQCGVLCPGLNCSSISSIKSSRLLFLPTLTILRELGSLLNWPKFAW